jgi:sulfur carrier protein ThiS
MCKVILLLSFYFFIFSDASSQSAQSKPTRQSALDAFSKGNYDLSYNLFRQLTVSYPKDPLYKYYCGVSLVRLERDPVVAETLLREAIQGSVAIKTVPGDALFYLGRAQQFNARFSDAIKSFNQYTEQAGKKAAKEKETPMYIQQCNDKKGALLKVAGTDKETNKKNNISPADKAVILVSGNKTDSDTAGSDKKPFSPGYESILNEALGYQIKADSLTKLAVSYRKQIESAPASEKAVIRSRISSAEQLAATNQKIADEKFAFASAMVNIKPAEESLTKEATKTDSVSINKEKTAVVVAVESGIMKDTIAGGKENVLPLSAGQISTIKGNKDSVVLEVQKGNITAQQKTEPAYSYFGINTKIQKPDEKVAVNPAVPPGLIYRIQVAVFRNPVAISYFKGIYPVYGFKAQSSDVTNYYAGMFRKSSDASKALVKVKTAGFKDAFVVALSDKKVVSSERAAMLEKEWGTKPFAIVTVTRIEDNPKDTIPKTLVFRVEASRSQKPLTTAQLDNLRRLSGTRGLDIVKYSSGMNIYLIGKFLTFEAASEYADLLKRNGVKDAKVVAYVGTKEIPVETARQLFEK